MLLYIYFYYIYKIKNKIKNDEIKKKKYIYNKLMTMEYIYIFENLQKAIEYSWK